MKKAVVKVGFLQRKKFVFQYAQQQDSLRERGERKKKRVLKPAGRAGWCAEALLACPVHVFHDLHHKMLDPSTNLAICLQLNLSYHLTWIAWH